MAALHLLLAAVCLQATPTASDYPGYVELAAGKWYIFGTVENVDRNTEKITLRNGVTTHDISFKDVTQESRRQATLQYIETRIIPETKRDLERQFKNGPWSLVALVTARAAGARQVEIFVSFHVMTGSDAIDPILTHLIFGGDALPILADPVANAREHDGKLFRNTQPQLLSRRWRDFWWYGDELGAGYAVVGRYSGTNAVQDANAARKAIEEGLINHTFTRWNRSAGFRQFERILFSAEMGARKTKSTTVLHPLHPPTITAK